MTLKSCGCMRDKAGTDLTCFHCDGTGRCDCGTCGESHGTEWVEAECQACKGTGKINERLLQRT